MSAFLARFLCALALLAFASVPPQILAAVWTGDFRWFISGVVVTLSGIAVGYGGITFADYAAVASDASPDEVRHG